MAKDSKQRQIEVGDYVVIPAVVNLGLGVRVIARCVSLTETVKDVRATAAYVSIDPRVIAKREPFTPSDCTLIMKADGTIPEVG